MGPPRATMSGLHHRREALDVPLGGLHVLRVHAAHLEIRIAQQVHRYAPEIPLGADVGARAEQDPESLLLRKPDEAGDVPVARREVEHPLGGLVVVPEQVGADGVAAHRLRHPDAMRPILGRDSGRVHLAPDDLKGRPVEQEVVGSQCEAMRRPLAGRRPRAGPEGDGDEREHDGYVLHRAPPGAAADGSMAPMRCRLTAATAGMPRDCTMVNRRRASRCAGSIRTSGNRKRRL